MIPINEHEPFGNISAIRQISPVRYSAEAANAFQLHSQVSQLQRPENGSQFYL
jgi:hypothetical protein